MLGKLFGGFAKKKDAASEKVKLSTGVGEQILSVVGARGIPPMPGNAQKAFSLAVNPNAEARDFIDLIKSDESLSARILRVSNSVYFDRGKKSTSIEDAVGVIGLNELRSLLNASSLTSLFPSSHPARTFAWNNDIATALFSKFLCDRFLPEMSSSAFLAGLMHDIGKLLLIQRATDEYTKVLKRVESDGMPFHLAEAEQYPFDHTEAGLLIAERWNFTDELKLVIRNHHLPFEQLTNSRFVGLVKAADMLSYSTGVVGGPAYNRFRHTIEEQTSTIWQYLEISAAEGSELCKQLKHLYDSEADLYRPHP
jgi:HD-like signal output (HDOD) protein